MKVLSAIRHIHADAVGKHSVRGQYRGYLNTAGIAEDSRTATCGAVRLYVDKWHWQGVRFTFRSGTKLAKKTPEIVIQFQRPSHFVFRFYLTAA